MHVKLKQGMWWVQPLGCFLFVKCKNEELMCFKAFLCQYMESLVFL